MHDLKTILDNFLRAEFWPIAVHEAGHAVVARALGGDVLLVEIDTIARQGKVDCRKNFTVNEDLAVSIAAWGAEHLLGARTPRTAKEGDREHMRELLSSLSDADRRTALAGAYHFADEKLTAHCDDVRRVAAELMQRWGHGERMVRINGNELTVLLGYHESENSGHQH